MINSLRKYATSACGWPQKLRGGLCRYVKRAPLKHIFPENTMAYPPILPFIPIILIKAVVFPLRGFRLGHPLAMISLVLI